MNLPSERLQTEHDLTCQQIEDRIHDLLDLRRSLRSDKIINKHVAACCHCENLVSDFERIGESFLQLPMSRQQQPSKLQPLMFLASVSCLLLIMLTSNVWLAAPDGLEIAAKPALAEVPLVATNVSEPMAAEAFDFFAIAEIADQAMPSDDLLYAVSLEQIGSRVEPFQNYLGMTAELPGIVPISDSVNLTIQFIQSLSQLPATNEQNESFSESPNLGFGSGFCASPSLA